jgi:formylglycine-generating enzyme required for sulfatase activity
LAYRENSKQNLKIPSQYLKAYDTNELLSDEEYYQELKYLNHPILTLSKEEARELCEWRTQITKYLWLHDTENLYKVQVANRINYRLPTLKELEKANTYFDKNDTYNYHNNSRIWKTRPLPDDYRYTLFSIYELTDGEETFKGHLKEGKEYDFTGFRCVCELKE